MKQLWTTTYQEKFPVPEISERLSNKVVEKPGPLIRSTNLPLIPSGDYPVLSPTTSSPSSRNHPRSVSELDRQSKVASKDRANNSVLQEFSEGLAAKKSARPAVSTTANTFSSSSQLSYTRANPSDHSMLNTGEISIHSERKSGNSQPLSITATTAAPSSQTDSAEGTSGAGSDSYGCFNYATTSGTSYSGSPLNDRSQSRVLKTLSKSITHSECQIVLQDPAVDFDAPLKQRVATKR